MSKYRKPVNSPWGPIEIISEPIPGLWSISTASHGGFMSIPANMSDAANAQAIRFEDGGSIYYCFEEDCKAAMVMFEHIEVLCPLYFPKRDVEDFRNRARAVIERYDAEYLQLFSNEQRKQYSITS